MAMAALACAAACGDDGYKEDPAREGVASIQQGVGDGVQDDTNRFPYVGWFTNADGGICSAVLITPFWAVTSKP